MVKRTIITYGTFDMFHIGHLNLLKRIKDMGSRLIVGVSTDEFNQLKGKKTLIPYEQRAAIVEAIKYVDLVIPESSWEQKIEDIKAHEIDLFVIGDDWSGKFDFLEEYCEVEYLSRTDGVSTTMLKQSLSAINKISKKDIISALDILDQLRKDLE
ncbi:glycerol-3-phosphate cytidylyltransferase [Thalassotalea agarivorans]|nr:glycerol-3-phosphate cytidylyltransferase [Thalassotalea agarivorans]